MKIVIPITDNSFKKALKSIDKAIIKADLIEIRLDMIKDIDKDKIKYFLKNKKIPYIITCRPRSDNINSTIDETSRIELLNTAIGYEADYIDIEYETDKRILKKFIQKKRNTKIIISHHNFKHTPDNLQNIFDAIKRLTPDMIKIIPYANDIYDNLIPLKLLKIANNEKIPLISFCMGEIGKISRIMSPYFGSKMIYAPLSGQNASAPGQISYEKMAQMIEMIKTI